LARAGRVTLGPAAPKAASLVVVVSVVAVSAAVAVSAVVVWAVVV
jgi:hypothetical protein